MSINFTFTENKSTVVSSPEKKGSGYLQGRQGRVLTTQRGLPKKGHVRPWQTARNPHGTYTTESKEEGKCTVRQ